MLFMHACQQATVHNQLFLYVRRRAMSSWNTWTGTWRESASWDDSRVWAANVGGWWHDIASSTAPAQEAFVEALSQPSPAACDKRSVWQWYQGMDRQGCHIWADMCQQLGRIIRLIVECSSQQRQLNATRQQKLQLWRIASVSEGIGTTPSTRPSQTGRTKSWCSGRSPWGRWTISSSRVAKTE